MVRARVTVTNHSGVDLGVALVVLVLAFVAAVLALEFPHVPVRVLQVVITELFQDLLQVGLRRQVRKRERKDGVKDVS